MAHYFLVDDEQLTSDDMLALFQVMTKETGLFVPENQFEELPADMQAKFFKSDD